MELTAILIGIVLLAGIVLFVSRPLLQVKRSAKAGGADAAALEAQRESLYTQIKELDMDHATGKVNDEDYVPLRAELVAQAAQVLKQIDSGAMASDDTADQADEVEALIAARRKSRSVPEASTTAELNPAEVDIEAAIAARRKTTSPTASSSEVVAPKCPKCGKPISADDAFCAKCGTALQPAAVH